MVYINRELEEEINKYRDTKEIIAVVGARQVGKTTLIEKILEKLKLTGKKINKLSFDDIKVLKLFEEDIDNFIERHVKGFDVLFIDEVHYSKESGKKLKYIYDSFSIKIFISGSSAAEMSIHSLKYLVGRIFTFVLHPFSFSEFLSAKDERLAGIYKKGSYKTEILKELNKYLKEFILFGGYPRVVFANSSEEKKKVLKEIYNTYLLKEIKDILGLSNNFHLVNLLKAISLQIGGIINYNEISSITGLSYFDLKRYFNILEKTYICSLVSPFCTNKRIEIAKSPKVYFFDLGFRNVCFDNFSEERPDIGVMHENLIFSELIKANLAPKYWRTKSGAEVDFILEKDEELIPIEVKSTIEKEKITKSFQSFFEKYKSKRGYILSSAFDKRRILDKKEVIFLPFVRFISYLKKNQRI